MMCVCVHTHIYIFIAQQIISCGSHWIKLIMWYKIGRWILDDICCLIWYASSDFVCKRWRPRNKQAFKLNFKSAMENKRILFVEVSDGENKKLVDNSTQTNTKKNPQNAGTIYAFLPWEIIQRLVFGLQG